MGVKWLTTYVRSIESIVSSSVRLSAGNSSNNKEKGQEAASEEEDRQEQGPVTFVVDGWAFIFHVYLSHFGDGVRSLDYARYRSFLHATLDAWDAAGIHAVFVFDGPMLPAKLPTILARRGGVVASNAAYMRASPASRTSRRFQCDCGLVAPLIYPATIDALQSWKRKKGTRRRRSSSSSSSSSSSNGKGRGKVNVNGNGSSNGGGSGAASATALEIVFAQTEADGLVAELAEERRGYALSIDSDYFILCARGAASKGYLPLDRIEYVFEKDPAQAALEEEARAKAMAEAAAAAAAAAASSSGGGDDGFEQVPSRRRDRRRGGAGVGAALNNNGVPPPSSRLRASESPEVLEQGGEQLSCINVQAYSAHALARQLQLPPNLMPLFAALCGNDYTPALQSTLLFRDVAPGPQRVSAAAAILRNEWSKVVGGGAPAALAAARRRRAAGIDERSEGASSATATPTTASASKRTVTARESAAIASPSALANNSSSSSSALDPVRAIVEAVVEGALASSSSASAPSPAAAAAASRYVSTGERRTLADSIIDSLATYSLLTHADAPYLASPSAGFFIPALRPRPSGSGNGSDGQQRALAAYRQAYMRGQLRPILVEAMTQRVFVATFFAEDPDAASVQATAARRLRRWLWAVLFDAWGMQWARESMDEPEVDAARDGDGDGDSGSEDPDEVISVDTDTSEEEEEDDAEEEEDYDNLPTRPGSAMDMHFGPAEPAVKPPPAVVEYVRRGDRLAGQLVRIVPLVEMLAGEGEDEGEGKSKDDNEGDALPPSLADLLGRHRAASASAAAAAASATTTATKTVEVATGTDADSGSPLADPQPPPAALLPLAVRIDLYLHAHGACTPAIRALAQPEMRSAVAVLRHAIVQHGTDPARRRTNWTRREAAVAIRTAYVARRRWTGEGATVASSSEEMAAVVPSTRAIHLATSWQLLTEASHLLAQSLLLFASDEKSDDDDHTDGTPSAANVVAAPHTLFHGPTFHTLMADEEKKHQQQQQQQQQQQAAAADAVEGVEMRKEERQALEAALQGLDDLLGIDAETLKRQRAARKKKEKEEAKEREREREKERQDKAAATAGGAGGRRRGAARAKTNAFALLAGIDADDED